MALARNRRVDPATWGSICAITKDAIKSGPISNAATDRVLIQSNNLSCSNQQLWLKFVLAVQCFQQQPNKRDSKFFQLIMHTIVSELQRPFWLWT